MKIIIPMSGLGKRFLNAGYTMPKPLIQVDGKPIIEYVVSMFPGDHQFIFICNRDHLATTNMEAVLKRLKPESVIIAIPEHKKGPVYAVTYAHHLIQDDTDVMISYCDYYMQWDLKEMLRLVKENGYAGAVPSYTGFHPHLIHRKLYGGVLTDDKRLMLDYKEKHTFTENPMHSHHSAGAYYFATGREMKTYSNEFLSSGLTIGGEVYMSMPYYYYLRDKKKIYVPEMKHFMQWGTPEDLEEYEAWSRYLHQKFGKKKPYTDIPKQREHLVVIPHPEDSQEFKDSEKYWAEYISNL